MMKRMQQIYPLLLFLLCIILTSCMTSPGPIPEDHFYKLPEFSPATQEEAAILQGSLGIKKILASGLLNERAILYTKEENPLELQRFRYHYWQTPPSDLVQEALRIYLLNERTADHIFTHEPGLTADYLLSGRLHRFDLTIGETESLANISLEIYLESAEENIPNFNKVYTAATTPAGTGLQKTVQAFGLALQKISHEFSEDLRRHLKHLPQ